VVVLVIGWWLVHVWWVIVFNSVFNVISVVIVIYGMDPSNMQIKVSWLTEMLFVLGLQLEGREENIFNFVKL
jgi:hypothetical protein